LDGAAFWQMLSTPRTAHTVLLRHGLAVEEFLYPRMPARRYAGQGGIPPLLLTTLPHLTDDPDTLYDEVGTVVRTWPVATLAMQYRRLFDWLCARLGRTLWIERSGVSLDLVPQVIHHFPTARVIHLYRDGRECAVSMSRHHYFRLAVIGRQMGRALGADPYDSADAPAADGAPPPWRDLLPDSFDVETYRATVLPPPLFGAVWSALIAKGLAALAQLPPQQVLTMRYETLVASPRAELQRLMEFVQPGLVDDRWLDEATALVRPRPATWPALPEQEIQLLDRACRPGTRLLCQAETDGLQSLALTPATLARWLGDQQLPQI
jgi:putative sulfotransferase